MELAGNAREGEAEPVSERPGVHGLIMVIGSMAKNGILLLDGKQRNLAAQESLLDCVVHAGRRELRRILMRRWPRLRGMLPLRLRSGVVDNAAAGDRGDRRTGLSPGLSMVVTPAVCKLYKCHECSPQASEYEPPSVDVWE